MIALENGLERYVSLCNLKMYFYLHGDIQMQTVLWLTQNFNNWGMGYLLLCVYEIGMTVPFSKTKTGIS